MERRYFRFLSLLVFVLSASIDIHAAKILGVFPFNTKSHFNFNEAIMKSLANAGHDVVVIAPFPTTEGNENENLKIIDSRVNKSETNVRYADHDFKSMSFFRYLRLSRQVLEQDCYDFMEVAEIRDMFAQNFVFDVMFVQLIEFHQCFLPLAKKLDIPVIGTLSHRMLFTTHSNVGNSYPLTFPFIFSGLPKNMTFYQRLANVYYHFLFKMQTYIEELPKLHEFYDKYHPQYNLEVDESVSFIFVNNHAAIQSIPQAPNVVEIGGIHLKPTKPLSQYLEKFIAESTDGVILFSMGTVSGGEVVDTKLREIFRSAFAEIRQRVIWKFPYPVANLSSNVLKLDWIPQLDILVHDNVKVFVSHCGLSGTYESIYAGKPMIMVPVILDQPTNAAMLHEYGVGVPLDLRQLTKERFLNAIYEVLGNPKYKRNMEKLSNAFKDRPTSPQRSVVYWTEYVLRHKGTEVLSAASKGLPSYRYLLVDVVSFTSGIALIAVYALYNMLKTFKGLLA